MNAQSDIMSAYLDHIAGLLDEIRREPQEKLRQVAKLLADHIAQDKLVHLYGPGGHSNMNATEVFFRAGGLMHISAILDEGTLISNGALRSMAVERTPGYGKLVIEDNRLQAGDILIIANAYGINTACIDAALEAKRRGVTTIAVTSVGHADATPQDHVARHPSRRNLYEVCDYYLDSKVKPGDAALQIDGIEPKMGSTSTFANAFLLNSLMMTVAAYLGELGVEVPVWRSGNAPGGDEWNNRFIERFKGRVRWL
ncbi:sugar isomerase domain-containing protein [Cohnella fermenti]|uniref:SIS domain-containing protein n=1 Tax=Cohnella fermenti TaxID=2565925 RepID=A0A4S4C8U6_9BACL|nr:SIS domain-containing protein [Cohnella fermenti]THF84469.1 SIS domain-containing protein [Cohnella fermenti]